MSLFRVFVRTEVDTDISSQRHMHGYAIVEAPGRPEAERMALEAARGYLAGMGKSAINGPSVWRVTPLAPIRGARPHTVESGVYRFEFTSTSRRPGGG